MAEATEKPAKKFTLDDVFALLPSNLPFFNHFSLGNVHCADLEISFLKCAEVTGLKNSKFKCKEQLDDFLECKTRMTDVSICVDNSAEAEIYLIGNIKVEAI